jgi:hydroxysqualene synthase
MTVDHPFSRSVSDAYRECERLARSHYENFPVASFFLPREKRPFLWSIYAFARTADDFADEGTLAPGERLRRLDLWQAQLDACAAGRPEGAVFIALADTIRRTGIPPVLLADLLTAFRMDVTTRSHERFADLLNYCRYSANPVGRLVLHVFNDASERNLVLSDAICTALQLTNFWQDVGVDRGKGRLYLPLEDCRRFGYNAALSGEPCADEAFRALLQHLVERTRAMFRDGRPLLREALPELRFELALTWHGGMRILDTIERQHYDVLGRRPALRAADKVAVVINALRERRS